MPVKKIAKTPRKNKTTGQSSLASEKKISNPGELFNLIKYLETEKVDEFEYSEADFSVSLKRTVKNDLNNNAGFDAGVFNMLVNRPAPASVQTQPQGAAEKIESKKAEPPAEDESRFKFIESPIIGTFYRAPSPSSPAYAEAGQRVKKGQVVCIVEAMKLMNEIKSEFDGVIERICVENGTLVQAKQRLFYVTAE